MSQHANPHEPIGILKITRHGPWSRWAWLPIPLMLAVIAALWVADLRTVYESRTAMVALNVGFSWLASLCICILTARSFLGTGQPGLLMFGCGSLVWGVTSLAAATVIGRDNATVTIHNVGVLAAALCHLLGLLWRDRRLPRAGRCLLVGYAAALAASAAIFWAAMAGWTPTFFVQGQGGTPVRQLVLLLAVASFAWVSWRILYSFGRQPGTFYYWYGLGLALFATGLTGVVLLSVQGGALGWVNRLTQYLGSAYLLIAALKAARKPGTWKFSSAAVEEGWRESLFLAGLRQRSTFGWMLRYGLAILTVAAANQLRLAMGVWAGSALPPYITFYPAVMIVAVLAGFGPGMAATTLAAVTTAQWILPPTGQFYIASPADRLGLMVFIGMGLSMSVASELYRRSRDKAAAYDREAAVRKSQARADESLRKSEQRYRHLFENIQEMVTVYEVERDEHGRIVERRLRDANPAFVRVVGASSIDQIRGRTSSEVFGKGWSVSHLAAVQEAMDTGEVRVQEVHRAESGRHYVTAIVPLDANTYMGTGWDITDRKRAEEGLRQAAEDLKRSNQDLEHFAHIASHDLQEPLRTVKAFLGLLQARSSDKLDEKEKQYIGFAVDGAGRMGNLITDLLAYSRAGSKGLNPSAVNVRHCVDQAMAALQQSLDESQAKVAIDELPTVTADEGQLRQVFQNLISNALKFHRDGVVPEITIGSALRDGQCVIRVKDNGIGIAANQAAKVFELFQRLHGREKYPGTGLGLAICKKIVERHGGRIWVESTLGEGSTFYFTLSGNSAA